MSIAASRLIAFLFISLLLLPSRPAGAQTATHKMPDALLIPSLNVRELTNSEIFRYARELYRKGDYAQSAKAFQRILKFDCTNRVAQYHIQQIIRKSPEFRPLKDWLAALPCEKYNFAEEDFLPAALYYEKDNDLLMDQLAIYNKRYRDNKVTLSAKIAEYAATAASLESQLKAMNAALAAEKELNSRTSSELSAAAAQAKQETLSMSSQVKELQGALAQASEARTAPVVSSSISTNTAALATLQEKFANIQARLEEVETSIATRNQHINDITHDLPTTH